MWFQLGRAKGGKILSLLCRISLEPDSCVKNTENLFMKRGANSLLISKFLPGLNTVAQPMAGIVRLSWPRFLAYNICGTLFWAGSILLVGRIFHRQIEDVLLLLRHSGASLLVIVLIAAAAWIAFKSIQRRRFIRRLRISRITPEELKEEIDRIVRDHSVPFPSSAFVLSLRAPPYNELRICDSSRCVLRWQSSSSEIGFNVIALCVR